MLKCLFERFAPIAVLIRASYSKIHILCDLRLMNQWSKINDTDLNGSLMMTLKN